METYLEWKSETNDRNEKIFENVMASYLSKFDENWQSPEPRSLMKAKQYKYKWNSGKTHCHLTGMSQWYGENMQKQTKKINNT